MLEARKIWPEDWPRSHRRKREPHPTPDTIIKPSRDAFTEGQRLIRGHGYIPEEFRPIEEVEDEKIERVRDPLSGGNRPHPIDEVADTTMNPEDALLAKEEEGEEAVKLGVVNRGKARADEELRGGRAYERARIEREIGVGSTGGISIEFSPAVEELPPSAYGIDTRRISAGSGSAPLTEEKGSGGSYTKKEVRDMAHGRKGPGGSGVPRSRQKIMAEIEHTKWMNRIDGHSEKRELRRFKFFREWVDRLNDRIREEKFGKRPASVRHHVEEELKRASSLFSDVYRCYEITIDGQTSMVYYKLKPQYNLPSMGRRRQLKLE